MEEKIIKVIEKIKPYINMDGGDIEFIKYEDGYVYVKMFGACVHCPSQKETLNDGLFHFLKEEIPEVKGVINTSN